MVDQGWCSMKLVSRSLILSVIAVCASFAVASAAIPRFGRTYVGSSASHKPLTIKVARDGKTGVLTYCGYKAHIHISRDHFGVHVTTAGGQVSVFRIHGSWQTPKLARGWIDLDFGCDGRPGAWSATLR
jgi:hypothetical protein